MDVVLGKSATLPTLLVKPSYEFIVWNYNDDGERAVNVATLTMSGLRVQEKRYQNRVSIDPDTGSLFLNTTTSADSGDYSITVLTQDGSTQTAEIKLRVLGECLRWLPGPRLGPLAHLPPPRTSSFSLFTLARRIRAFCNFSVHLWRSRAPLMYTLKRARWCFITFTPFSSRKPEFTGTFDPQPGTHLCDVSD